MTNVNFRILADVVNHNAHLLENHFGEDVFVHQQTTPSKTWQVTHSLGSLRPHIDTYDSNGNLIGHAVNRKSQTFAYCEIVFAIPVAGTAIIRF